MAANNISPIKRFLKNLIINKNGCWEWQRHLVTGYGRFRINYKHTFTHRFIYEYYYGKINNSLVLDHLCRNRKCCNPKHLEVVTQKENINRGLTGTVHTRKTHCPKGHPYSGDNLYITPNGDNQCRTCLRTHHHNYNRRKYQYV